MYSTCLFCNVSLGANEVIEHFPVGRRLAYNAAAGRLWVVCTKCGRWNLSPLESRWEAIEDAERLFRATRKRVSTDNVGLCRLADGTDLVRVGKPLRPEFAAWRYGDQFLGRQRKFMVKPIAWATIFSVPASAILLEAAMQSNTMWIPFSGIVALTGGIAAGAQDMVATTRRSLRLRGANNEILNVSVADSYQATISPAGHAFEWQLNLPTAELEPATGIRKSLGMKQQVRSEQIVHLRNDDARRVLANILPHINYVGGRKSDVASAVEIVEDAPNANYLLHQASIADTPRFEIDLKEITERRHARRFRLNLERVRRLNLLEPERVNEATISHLPLNFRLALEMSLHEDDERRAMQGELLELEARWREAETIAKIADGMFDSETASARLAELRDGASGSSARTVGELHADNG